MYRVTWLVFLGVLHRLKPSSERPTQLNSTQLNSVSFSHDPVYVWPHDVNINTNIIYLITDIMYCVYKNVHGNGVVGRRDSSGLLWIWVSNHSNISWTTVTEPALAASPARINVKLAKLCYLATSFQQPGYLADFISPYSQPRLLRSSIQKLLSVPPHNLDTAARRFSVAVPRLWNSLPLNC